MYIDSGIACIIARELAEGALFITSHIGAVLKNPVLSYEKKKYYLWGLIPAVVIGTLSGLIISIAVGFSIARAIGQLEAAEEAVEVGEAVSKTIAAFFVIDMTLKIPSWFGISKSSPEISDAVPEKLSQSAKVDELHTTPMDLEKNVAVGVAEKVDLGSRFSLSMSLFWNTLRESTEGGILTAFAALLSQKSMHSLGESIGVGIAAAVILGGGLALGGKYVSQQVFGIMATIIGLLLSMGLVAGATRSFEEVYAENHDGAVTYSIYDAEDTQTGHILSAFGFAGISDHCSVVVLILWIFTFAALSLILIWKHYLGSPSLIKIKRILLL